jgi:hypothetical protein
MGKAARIRRIVTIDGELVAIILVQPALGPNPQEPLPVLQDGVDLAKGQAFGNRDPVEADGGRGEVFWRLWVLSGDSYGRYRNLANNLGM